MQEIIERRKAIEALQFEIKEIEKLRSEELVKIKKKIIANINDNEKRKFHSSRSAEKFLDEKYEEIKNGEDFSKYVRAIDRRQTLIEKFLLEDE